MAERTPPEWLQVLERRLHARWGELAKFDAYYNGAHELSYISQKIRETFPQFRDLRDNYMRLVVDAPAERLRVQGFRFEDDPDDDAWEIWQANGLDAQANMVHTEAIKLREAYWLVQPNGTEFPRITAEHPSQVIVACAPGDHRTRVAALKEYQDEDGYVYANVYLPDRYVRYRTRAPLNRVYYEVDFDKRWETIAAGSNPLGVVPVVPMPNNPAMLTGGQSDLDGGILSLQDQINGKLVTLAGGEEFQGLPQRVMLGVEPPRDPETGRVIRDVEANKSRLWFFNNENAKAFQFDAAELKNLRDAVDAAIGDIAAQARIPIFYFRPSSISNISAEGLIALEAGLVSKVDDKKDAFGEGHEEAIRLAFKAMDPEDPRAEATSAETIWENTENRSEAQLADAVTKKSAIGVPWEQCMEDLGYSPQQIERMAAQKETDNFLAPEPAIPPANQPVPGTPQPVPVAPPA